MDFSQQLAQAYGLRAPEAFTEDAVERIRNTGDMVRHRMVWIQWCFMCKMFRVIKDGTSIDNEYITSEDAARSANRLLNEL